MKVTLDPGHGENGNPYPAAPGYFEGTQMWKLSLFMAAELERLGFEVANTRPKVTDNPPLESRGGMAAKNGSVMFYSLHSNAPGLPTQTTVTGSEIFLPAKGEQFKPLAASLLAAVCSEMGHNSRGVKPDPGNAVIRSAVNGGLHCAMLMEHGFHTNPNDAAFLVDDENLKKLAAAQAAVIAAYFGVSQLAVQVAVNEGDIVMFTGGAVYASSTTDTPSSVRDASRCKVTKLNNGARNPLHLVSEDGGGIFGWVAAGSVELAGGQAPSAPFEAYRARIKDGTVYRSGPSATAAVAGVISETGVFTIVEEYNGWGRLKSGAGWVLLSAIEKV